jgi:hypothetical protein
MDSSSIQLADSEIATVSLADGRLRIDLSRAYIVNTMTGSTEKTLWWQAGTLVIEDAEAEAPLPRVPGVCDGGDIDDNIYTYRDMIPIPLQSRGHIRCDLRLRDDAGRIVAAGSAVRLEMRDTPKYIRHIRED